MKEQLIKELIELLQNCTESQIQALIDVAKIFPKKED